MWIARDKDNSLYFYNLKPNKFEDAFAPLPDDREYMRVESYMFPEITWENSPIEIEIK